VRRQHRCGPSFFAVHKTSPDWHICYTTRTVLHTVKQGEHTASIALKYGFYDWQVVWNDPNNAALKKLRENPNVLYPGDQLYIPDKQQKEEPCKTTQTHHFKLARKKIRLSVQLRDFNSKPLANIAAKLEIDGQVKQIKTNGEGKIDELIPTPARSATLTANGKTYRLQVGDLDPVSTPSGQLARLANLGYFLGRSPDDGNEFRSAVEEFQCDYDLAVDGDCGPKTQGKLKEVHGS
jgi:Putative peptidoglycan binding domain